MNTGFINRIEVKNFKSLKRVRLDGCKRINLLIGRPNVGKSNLLEALSLFDIPFLPHQKIDNLRSLVRAEHFGELFFDGNMDDGIEVSVNGNESVSVISKQHDGGIVEIHKENKSYGKYIVSQEMELSADSVSGGYKPGILSYKVSKNVAKRSFGTTQLLPPAGPNLMEVVKQLPLLKDEISGLMASYGLKMVYDNVTQELKALKEKSDEIFLIPFSSLADSLQRMIFNKAAILSNHDKVICLEEPETHTFPPYIASVVQDIIDAEDNQFFISTHSPYVTNSLMEAVEGDLGVYFLNLENGETTVKHATDEEVQEMYDNGVDLFFNMETYL